MGDSSPEGDNSPAEGGLVQHKKVVWSLKLEPHSSTWIAAALGQDESLSEPHVDERLLVVLGREEESRDDAVRAKPSVTG